MGVTIRPPTERLCERCGRHDVWDTDRWSWVIATEDGEKQVGDPQCLHEWDINGSYNPIAEEP
ncbi:MAG: HEWD family protein [Haloarculaceae archaeon]